MLGFRRGFRSFALGSSPSLLLFLFCVSALGPTWVPAWVPPSFSAPASLFLLELTILLRHVFLYTARRGCRAAEPSVAARGTPKRTFQFSSRRGARGAPLRNPASPPEVRQNALFHFLLEGAPTVPRFGTQRRRQTYAKTHFSIFFYNGREGCPASEPRPVARVATSDLPAV
jgi:hypothetical protein